MTADTDTLEHPGNAREWLTILGMIVPLTHEEAVERAHRLAGLPEDASLSEGVPHFACRHWDEETRLCTIYDQRPWMCRTYPSVKCGHGCGRRADPFPLHTRFCLGEREMERDRRRRACA